jgi:Domain of unknown function (DUF6602)
MYPRHHLSMLSDEAAAQLATKHLQIRTYSRQDPGTAGDQAEENWAGVLREWLPASYHVCTKGRILFANNDLSPQVDIVVLAPGYPQGLLDRNEKLYLAAGVLSAFECKTTLRMRDLPKVFKTSARLGELAREQPSTERKPLFGLLAHTAEISETRQSPQITLDDAITAADAQQIRDPRDCLDFVCIPDLGTWIPMRHLEVDGDRSCVVVSYLGPFTSIDGSLAGHALASPLGRFLTALLRRLGSFDPSLTSLARYFEYAGEGGSGVGNVRYFPFDQVPEELRQPLY